MIRHMELTKTQRDLIAERAGIAPEYLYQILTKRKTPSAELCVTLERESIGMLTRKALRPDDWQRIWPEIK